MVSLSKLNPIFQELLRAMFPGIVLEGIDDQVPPTVNNNNDDEEEEEEEEEDDGPTNIEPATVGIATTSSCSSLDRTATTLNSVLRSSSTQSSLSSASSVQSALGDQSDKGDSVGNGNTQSNLNGGNGELESQSEEGESDSGDEAGDEAEDQDENDDEEEDEEGNDPNLADQEEAPSLDGSASQEEAPSEEETPVQNESINDGNQDDADGNESDASISDLVPKHPNEGAWYVKLLNDSAVLSDSHHSNLRFSRLLVNHNGLLDELVSLSQDGPLTSAKTIEVIYKYFPECSGQSGLTIDQEVFKWITADQLKDIERELATFVRLYLARHPAPAPEAFVPAASPAVRALESTSTPVLNGIIDFLVRFINGKGQDQASFPNFTPTGGDDGVAPLAPESKAEAFLKKCDDNYYGAFVVWLGDTVKRVQLYGQAYDCNVRFNSLRANFLQALPQVQRTLPLIPGLEEFNGALSDPLLLVLIDRFLTANIHVAIEHLDRHFVKPVVGPSQSLADDLAFTEKSLFDDETAGNFDLALGLMEPISPLPGFISSVLLRKYAFLNVAGIAVRFEKIRLEEGKDDSIMDGILELICFRVFNTAMQKMIGLDAALKSVEARIGLRMLPLIFGAAFDCRDSGEEFSSRLSVFVWNFLGQAVREADYVSNIDPVQVESDFRRRQYTQSSDVSGSILCTLEWGSFLVAEDGLVWKGSPPI